MQKTDQQVLRDSWPAYTIAHQVQTQRMVKDNCWNKSRDKVPVSASAQDFLSDKDKSKKDKKKKQHMISGIPPPRPSESMLRLIEEEGEGGKRRK